MMTIKEMRAACKMERQEFADYFHVSKRSIENWESTGTSARNCPEYLLELMEYKLRHEGLLK